jgi:hypothetical protein
MAIHFRRRSNKKMDLKQSKKNVNIVSRTLRCSKCCFSEFYCANEDIMTEEEEEKKEREKANEETDEQDNKRFLMHPDMTVQI